MANSFSLGIRRIWQELSAMQSPGFYWVNIDRQNDANLFCRQIIAAQEENSQLALICSGNQVDTLLATPLSPAIKKFPLYSLPEKKAALLHLADDLMRELKPSNRLLILLAHASLWQTFTSDELRNWAAQLGQWLHQRQCTLVILSHGSGVSKLKGQLAAEHRILNGLASLQGLQGSAQYLVPLVEHGKRHQCQSVVHPDRRPRRLARGGRQQPTLPYPGTQRREPVPGGTTHSRGRPTAVGQLATV
ncbi:cellulose biosynthesis protein BcsE [Serratia fonticola]|uniref:Cellulose biosynthesis protein BcsE n=1 Tax=Serratia fonticola TaxID=47917 RepID=A0A4U9VTD8_SERFO|nr:cellulose biosynthesis protein BcsE [Serratia fonticola]